MTERKTIRCAVYTRKSTEHNLDLEFNSLDAQREACEAYIKSQVHEGWVLVPDHYDDGGISGGSLDRPDLQRLLSDIRSQKVNIVVVYKVDRLTRSLTDFAKLVEIFDDNGASFVSITQSFNTTSSMGRLTLNILLSFAQFEREVIGERVRDKVAASKAKGMWMGGNIPLGYITRDKKLIVQPDEAETVRFIYRRYLEIGSVGLLLKELSGKGIKTKRFERPDGSVRGGVRFEPGTIRYLLQNRLYVGEIAHRGQIYVGDHEAILDKALFEAVQAQSRANARTRKLKVRAPGSLLTGILYDSVGNKMTPTYTIKKGARYRYYISHGILKYRDKSELGEVRRVSAPAVEEVVLGFLHQRTKVVGDVGGALQGFVERIIVRSDALEIHLAQPKRNAERLDTVEPVLVAWQPKVNQPEKGIAHCCVGARREDDRARKTLIVAIAKSRRWVREMIGGAELSEIADSEGCSHRHAHTLLNLAFISPRQVRALADGSGPAETITSVAGKVPLFWPEPG